MKQDSSKTQARLKQDSSKTQARQHAGEQKRLKNHAITTLIGEQYWSNTEARMKQDWSKTQARLKQDSKQGNKNVEKPLRFSSIWLKKSNF